MRPGGTSICGRPQTAAGAGSSGSPARPAPNCPRCSTRWPNPAPSRDCTTTRPSRPPVDARTHGQRLHDALEDVCDRLLRGSNDPDTKIPDAGGTPATVIITVDLQDLLAKTGYATASDGTLIRTDQALRLADQAEVYCRRRHREGCAVASGPDAADRHPRPNHRPDRPRQRLLLPRLRCPPGMVRTPPHPGLARRWRNEPEQPHPAVPLPPPQLRRPRLDLPDQPRRTSRNGRHPGSSTGTNDP